MLSFFTRTKGQPTFSANGYEWGESSFPKKYFTDTQSAFILAEELFAHEYPLTVDNYANHNAIQREIENFKKSIGKLDSEIAKLNGHVQKFMIRVGHVENNPSDGFNGAEMADLTRFFIAYSARLEELTYSKKWHEEVKKILEKYLKLLR